MTAQSFRRLLLAAAAVCLLGLAAGTSAGSSSATPAALAARLAGAVDNAHTGAQRTRAVLAIAEALGWPVVSRHGHVVYAGARNLPRGFLLYDFELASVADGVARGETFSIADLAAVLTKAGVRPKGRPVDPTALRRALVAAVAAAARKPAAQASLVGLIVRDLGVERKHGRIDLASPPSGALQLDAAQTLVVVADVTIGAAGAHSRRTLDVSRAQNALRGSGSPCDGLNGLKDALSSGKLGVGILGGIISSTVRAVTVSIEAVHGVPMSLYIEAKATTSQDQSTHYGPPGHGQNSGKVLKLKVLVFNHAYPPDILVSCGPLLGVKWPEHGAMAGIPVTWGGIDDIGLDSALNLPSYGTVEYDPADGKTGHDGVARLTFTPKNELIPGFGTVRTGKKTGVHADVHWASALGNILGIIAGFYVPLRVDYRVTVTAHVPRGFKFGPADFRFVQTPKSPPPANIDLAVQGHLCGDNPWTEPWNIEESLTVTAPGIPSDVTGANYQVSIPQAGSTSTGSDFVHKWSLPAPAGPVDSTNPFRLHLTITPTQSYFNGTVTPGSLTVQAEVTEDTTCPLDSNWRLGG